MNLGELKALMEKSNRKSLYKNLLNKFREFTEKRNIFYKEVKISDGIIPILRIFNKDATREPTSVKCFVAAQHNEYNGLFGILEYLEHLNNNDEAVDQIINRNQDVLFFPLMNPYGFLNPSPQNKSGYFLKNGTNLNRYWRRTFIEGYEAKEGDAKGHKIPDNAIILKNALKKYWVNEEIPIFLLDFHETSLLERFPPELVNNLSKKSITYKFDHWLKEGIILNVIKLYKIPYYRKPLFFKCSESADHTHLNLSMKQIDIVHEKLIEYICKNSGKLPFYFCYSKASEEYCKILANAVYEQLKDILWNTYYPAFSHYFHDHGCFVKMNNASSRPNLYTLELEAQKQFYNLEYEKEKAQSDPNYYAEKLKYINMNNNLVLESIKQLIALF